MASSEKSRLQRRPRDRAAPAPSPRRRRWPWGLLPIAALVAWGLWPSGPTTAGGGAGAATASPARADGDSSDDGGEAPAAAASLGGKVVERGAGPVAGARVVLADDADRLRETSSGDGGSFHFDDLPPGNYRLQAEAGALTCDPLGPLPVAAGDDLRGLVIELSPGVRLAGRVLDLRTRQGIGGATLTVAGSAISSTADPGGRYLFAAVPAGDRTIVAEAQGYLKRSVRLSYPPGASAAGLDLYLRRAAHVAGIVVDPGGTPVPGASLWASRYRASGEDAPLAPLARETGPDGRFAADVEPGLYRLVARSPGFAEGRSGELDLAEGSSREDLRLALAAGGEIDGTVVDSAGAPVASGRVQALLADDRWPVAETALGAGGRFSLHGVPAGHLVVVADAAQARGEAEASLESGGQAQVEIRLGAETLEGSVDDGSGSPVAGALVVARPVGLGEAGERSTLSAANGSFHLGGLVGGRFDVAASKDDGSAELRGIVAGSRDVHLSLAVGSVSGWVESPDGAGITDFTLSAEPQVPGRGRPRSQHVFDARGEFKLVLAPGSYVLRASAPGYAEGLLSDVSVAGHEPTSGLHLQLRPSGTIDGLVLDASTGAPLVGIHVAVDRGHAWAVGREAGGASATSGLDGRFALRDVAPGRWPVFADSADFELAGPPPVVAVDPGADSPPVELRMRRAGKREQEYAGIGMSIWQRGGSKFAAEVFEGGPAFEAGVRGGDEILAVDGAAAQSLGLPDLVARIRGPVGSEVTLDMQRSNGGPGYEVVVPRADIKMF